jgi:acyl dehydratase
MRIPAGNAYSKVEVGVCFEHALTVTETHLVTAAGLFGDFNPLHVDEEFAAKSRYGTRVLHGPFTAALMATSVGLFFSGTAIGYLEHCCRFTAPVRPGDTLTTCWTVVGKEDKPRHQGGIIELEAVCRNQEGIDVANGEGRVLVGEGEMVVA